MFERVITQTIQRISTEILRDRQSIPLAEILEDERFPARFKPFFATEVRWWLRDESLARTADKRFDVNDPELSSLIEYLDQVMFRHARFDREDFAATLDGAVKLTYNYLCRPQTTLKWYIFRGQPVKPLEEVMLRFGAFLDYEYFGDVFSGWVERKVRERATFEAISAIEFERIIRRVDDQILLSCTVDELLALLEPMFDFIGDGAGGSVPLDALIIFFDDKNILRLVDHLERYRTGPDVLVTRQDFVRMLDELLTSSEENPEADFSSVYQQDDLDEIVRLHLENAGRASTAQAAIEPDELHEGHLPARPRVDHVGSAAAAAIAERRHVEESPQAASAPPAGEAAAESPDVSERAGENSGLPQHEVVAASIAEIDERTALPSRALPESPGAAAVPQDGDAAKELVQKHGSKISDKLDPMLERKILKKVFGGDRDAYRDSLRRLESAGTWREASRILDEIFVRFDVDPYSRTALRFTDSVYSRFVPKNHT